MRVFLAEPNNKFSLYDAKDFGAITYLSRERLNPFDIEHFTEQIVNALDHHQFDPKTDIICLTGHTLTINFLMSIIASRWKGPFFVLMFDSRDAQYRKRVFNPRGVKEYE